MGNEGLPISLVVLICVVILGALGLLGWITTTLISTLLATPAQ
jgi:hypothetical protein